MEIYSMLKNKDSSINLFVLYEITPVCLRKKVETKKLFIEHSFYSSLAYKGFFDSLY